MKKIFSYTQMASKVGKRDHLNLIFPEPRIILFFPAGPQIVAEQQRLNLGGDWPNLPEPRMIHRINDVRQATLRNFQPNNLNWEPSRSARSLFYPLMMNFG